MDYMIIGKRGDTLFEVSSDEIKRSIKTHSPIYEIQLTEYLFDETGNICAVKGLADLGHGYGFDYGCKEFVIKPGETYSFIHNYTSADGPTDWTSGSLEVSFRLAESK